MQNGDVGMEIIRELYETEKTYCRILMSFSRIVDLFIEVEDLLLFSRMGCLCDTLVQLAFISFSSCESLRRSIEKGDRIGKVLLRVFDLFPFFEQYAGFYSFLKTQIEDLCGQEAFSTQWRYLAQQETIRHQKEDKSAPNLPSTFLGFLILPFQRIPRYELLLVQLITEYDKEPAEWIEERFIVMQVISKVKHTNEEMELCLGGNSKESFSHLFETQIPFNSRSVNMSPICKLLFEFRNDLKYIIGSFVSPFVELVDSEPSLLEEAQKNGIFSLCSSLVQLWHFNMLFFNRLMDSEEKEEELEFFANLGRIYDRYIRSYIRASPIFDHGQSSLIGFTDGLDIHLNQMPRRKVPAPYIKCQRAIYDLPWSSGPLPFSGGIEPVLSWLRKPLEHVTRFQNEIRKLLIFPGQSSSSLHIQHVLAVLRRTRSVTLACMDTLYFAHCLRFLRRISKDLSFETRSQHGAIALRCFGIARIDSAKHATPGKKSTGYVSFVWVFQECILYASTKTKHVSVDWPDSNKLQLIKSISRSSITSVYQNGNSVNLVLPELVLVLTFSREFFGWTAPVIHSMDINVHIAAWITNISA